MNRWFDYLNLDLTSHLSLTESTIMMGEPASAETRGRWKRDGGGPQIAGRKEARDDATFASLVSESARLSLVHVHARPTHHHSAPSFSFPLSAPAPVARVGIHLSAITGLDDNAAISGRRLHVRRPRPPLLLQRERARSLRP